MYGYPNRIVVRRGGDDEKKVINWSYDDANAAESERRKKITASFQEMGLNLKSETYDKTSLPQKGSLTIVNQGNQAIYYRIALENDLPAGLTAAKAFGTVKWLGPKQRVVETIPMHGDWLKGSGNWTITDPLNPFDISYEKFYGRELIAYIYVATTPDIVKNPEKVAVTFDAKTKTFTENYDQPGKLVRYRLGDLSQPRKEGDFWTFELALITQSLLINWSLKPPETKFNTVRAGRTGQQTLFGGSHTSHTYQYHPGFHGPMQLRPRYLRYLRYLPPQPLHSHIQYCSRQPNHQ